jgi:hypothetical protein
LRVSAPAADPCPAQFPRRALGGDIEFEVSAMSKMDKSEAYKYKLELMADEYEIEANPAPGPKWQALKGIPRIPNLCGATQSLLECLIELADEEWGFSFPSRKFMRLWTGRSRQAIDRALAKGNRLDLIETVERRIAYDESQSSLILVRWDPFFAAYRRVQNLREKNRPAGNGRRLPENGQTMPENGQTMPESENHSTSYRSESYRSESYRSESRSPGDLCNLLPSLMERKKGFQKRGT